MSLYYEAASFLSQPSVKSRIFNSKTLKSSPKLIYPLVTEASKWSRVLKEVIENSELLTYEHKLSPDLALLLVYDLLLSKRGIAAPKSHPLTLAVTRHKARLYAEFTKARVRKGFASLADLEAHVNNSLGSDIGSPNEDFHQETIPKASLTQKWSHPRWVRINTLRTSLDEQLKTTFVDYKPVESIGQLLKDDCGSSRKIFHVDKHIPDLLAIPFSNQLTKLPAYLKGLIILQDKGSCFPAYLLDPKPEEGDILDACAAPGNKTTHLATFLQTSTGSARKSKIWACERDKGRSLMLEKMVEQAGTKDMVNIKAGQDFLTLNPLKAPWNEIGSLLLDPSCSGSGIIGRDEVLKVFLPGKPPISAQASKSQKRKRHTSTQAPPTTEYSEQDPSALETTNQPSARLDALSTFQLALLQHAFHFPRARKIVYSTCSLYAPENESVVIKALASPIARDRGWRIMRRDEQVRGAKAWPIRGDAEACRNVAGVDGTHQLSGVAEHCIRCEKGTEEGTQGFFVAAFVRDTEEPRASSSAFCGNLTSRSAASTPDLNACESQGEEADGDLEWQGFSDDDDAFIAGTK